MRLLNQQVDALVKKYATIESEALTAKQEKELKSPQIQKEAKRLLALRNKYKIDSAKLMADYEKVVPSIIRDWRGAYIYDPSGNGGYKEMTLKDVAEIVHQIANHNKQMITRDWRQEIILASIDSTTIVELEKKLKL